MTQYKSTPYVVVGIPGGEIHRLHSSFIDLPDDALAKLKPGDSVNLKSSPIPGKFRLDQSYIVMEDKNDPVQSQSIDTRVTDSASTKQYGLIIVDTETGPTMMDASHFKFSDEINPGDLIKVKQSHADMKAGELYPVLSTNTQVVPLSQTNPSLEENVRHYIRATQYGIEPKVVQENNQQIRDYMHQLGIGNASTPSDYDPGDISDFIGRAAITSLVGKSIDHLTQESSEIALQTAPGGIRLSTGLLSSQGYQQRDSLKQLLFEGINSIYGTDNLRDENLMKALTNAPLVEELTRDATLVNVRNSSTASTFFKHFSISRKQ